MRKETAEAPDSGPSGPQHPLNENSSAVLDNQDGTEPDASLLKHDSSRVLEPSNSQARMQLDKEPPASDVVIPDKINEEQHKGGQDQKEAEEEKKLEEGKIARLNIGSAES